MLKAKKGLKSIVEEEPIMAPQPLPQPEAATHAEAEESWQMLLAKALAAMPADVLVKVVDCIPREMLINVIKARENDPVVKLALVLLNAQRQD